MATAVLFTGGSSFTGYWFVQSMADRGMSIVAPLRGSRNSYEGLRARRVELLQACAEVIFDCPFGGASFLELAGSRAWDALGHHAADVTGYNRWSFDALAALQANVANAELVFTRLAERGARAVVVTGTVFEAGAGGAVGALAANPYGLSKTLSTEALRHFATWAGLHFGHFVIANPFGLLEEKRFGWYLFKTWLSGETPIVKTPEYVRDNVPVSMLAAAYADYIEAKIKESTAPAECRPSGLVMSQGAFARMAANEVSGRIGRSLQVNLAHQVDFSEPYLRVNDTSCLLHREIPRFWDQYVEYYCDLKKSGYLN